METINVKFSTTSKNDVQHQTGYSGGILAAVAVSCIFGTLIVVLITYIIVQRIRMLKTAKKATSNTNESYDELGLRRLPSVYDTVQQTSI